MWKLTVENDLQKLSLHEQYFEYSKAYLCAALIFCKSLVEFNDKQTYTNGAVVLYLTFHATELFLKGAILSKHPGESLNHHKINLMKPRYRKLYPGKRFAIEFPFETEPSEIELPKEYTQWLENFEYDQMYRYPNGLTGDAWQKQGMYPSFEASSFYNFLTDYHTRVTEIIEEIINIGNQPFERTR